MGEIYTALGLMSGTSMDGIDVSIIKSDGDAQFINILDEYYEFDTDLRKKLVETRNSVLKEQDLSKYSTELDDLERQLTLFHAFIIKKILSKYKEPVDIIGFHGQTIYHNPKIKITKQLGDGKLLSQLIKKTVVYDFRKNDLHNGGQGAPLTPIFHNLLCKNLSKNFNDKFSILNIGGISNVTKMIYSKSSLDVNFEAFDIGPGNCLIDEWIRKNSNKKFDNNGQIGKSGRIDQLILNQAIDNFNITSYENSLDIKDFDISFAKGLSLADGCATITNYTGYLISEGLKFLDMRYDNSHNKYLLCGGGRKNSFLIDIINNYIENYSSIKLQLIDDFNYNGDFIESQAFGYLAIRSYLGLPITYPSTTRCIKPLTGGVIVKNY